MKERNSRQQKDNGIILHTSTWSTFPAFTKTMFNLFVCILLCSYTANYYYLAKFL